jgi:hypothetical protein
VKEGTKILEEVNEMANEVNSHKPIYIVGDLNFDRIGLRFVVGCIEIFFNHVYQRKNCRPIY